MTGLSILIYVAIFVAGMLTSAIVLSWAKDEEKKAKEAITNFLASAKSISDETKVKLTDELTALEKIV